MFPEGTDEGGSSADALENLSGGMSEIPKVFWTKVWQCVLLKVAPQVFHWVEFRRVSGHELDLQSLTLSGDKLGDDLAAVDRRAVPQRIRSFPGRWRKRWRRNSITCGLLMLPGWRAK